jgi:hypothetical protein
LLRDFVAGLRGWRPYNAARVFAICAMFGVLILSGTYAARECTTLVQSAAAPGAGGSGDRAVRFADTDVGEVLFASPRSGNCRRVLFDNRTGAYHEANDVFCGQAEEAVPESPKRLDAVRRSFQR